MSTWNVLRFPAREDRIWELYHENSKTASFLAAQGIPFDIAETLQTLHVSLPIHGSWEKRLTNAIHLELSEVTTRNGAEEPPPVSGDLTFDRLCAILRFTTENVSLKPPHSIQPLEIFGFIRGVEWIPSGVFHFDREHMEIRLVGETENDVVCSEHLPNTGNAQLWIFITAVFQRSALIFGEKGYRVALSESGRMAQNILMAAHALGLSASLEVQYHERKIEEFIGIDGVDHALLQVITI